MASTQSIVLIPRCIPFDAFKEYLRRIREVYRGHRLAILESNPDNLKRYDRDIEVIHYKGKAFQCDEIQTQLADKLDRQKCAAIIIPLSNQDGQGFEQLIRFARTCDPAPAYVMTPDLSFRQLSGSAAGSEKEGLLPPEENHLSACYRNPDETIALVGWMAVPDLPSRELTVHSDPESAPIKASIFRYPHPGVKSMGDVFGIAIFTAEKINSGSLWVRVSEAGLYEFNLKQPDPASTRDEFLKAFNYFHNFGAPSVQDKIEVNKSFFKVFDSISAKANREIKVTEKLQLGIPSANPQVSIVIPIYKAQHLVRHQFADFAQDAFLKQQQIILVYGSVESEEDSPDRFKLRMHRLFELYRVPCKVLITSRNCSFAMACNLGVAEAAAPNLLLLNSDIFPKSKNWLQTLVSDLEGDPSIGIAGARLLYPDESVQHVGLTWRREPSLHNLLINIHPYKGMSPTLVPFNGVREEHAVTGACMLLRTREYLSMGMLDPGFMTGDYEDSDICLRYRTKGLKTVCDNRVELYHLEGASYQSSVRQSLHFVNACRHEEKWGEIISSLIENQIES